MIPPHLAAVTAGLPYRLRDEIEGNVTAVDAAAADIAQESGIELTESLRNQLLFVVGIRHLWAIIDGPHWRVEIAIFSASPTSSAGIRDAIAQPTIRWVHASSTAAVQPASPGAHLRDVGYPELVGAFGREVPVHQVRCGSRACGSPACPRPATPRGSAGSRRCRRSRSTSPGSRP